MRKLLFISLFLLSMPVLAQLDTVSQQRIYGMGTLSGLLYTPDGQSLISYGGRGIIIRNAATGQVERIIETEDSVYHADMSADGRWLATNRNTSAVIYDLSNGAIIKRFYGHETSVSHVRFNPDATLLATSSPDGTVRFWDVASETERKDLRIVGSINPVPPLWFVDNGQKLLAKPYNSFEYALWDVATGKEISVLESIGDAKFMISADTTLLATVGDNTVDILDSMNGDIVHTLNHDLHLASSSAYVKGIKFSPDNQFLAVSFASTRYESETFIWHITTGEIIQHLAITASSSQMAFSTDNYTFAISEDTPIFLIDLHSSNAIEEARIIEGHNDAIVALGVGGPPDRLRLYGVTAFNMMHAWKFRDATRLPTAFISHDMAFTFWGERRILSPSGQFYAIISFTRLKMLEPAKGDIERYSIEAGRQLYEIGEAHKDSIRSFAFSPDEHTIATGARDKLIKLRESATGRLIQVLEGSTDSVEEVVFSADGQQIISASQEGVITIWDWRNGLILDSFTTDFHSDSKLILSPDETLLAFANNDNDIVFWNMQDMVIEMTLSGHNGAVSNLLFSQDGKYLLSASFDGTLRLWSTPDETVVFCLTGKCSSNQ